MHHTITDGEGGVQMSLQYLDFERDAPDPPPRRPGHDRGRRAAAGAVDGGHAARPAGRRLPAADRRRPPGQRAARRPGGDPGGERGDGRHRARRHHPALRRRAGASSPLWTERSLRRRLEVVRAPFRETKDAAKRLGGTLNTAFLTAAAEAAVALPRRARRTRSSTCGRRWRSAPAPPTPAPTPSRSPG